MLNRMSVSRCACGCIVKKDTFDRVSFGPGYTINNGGGTVHLVSNHIEMLDVAFGSVTYSNIPEHFSIQADFRLHDHRDVVYIEVALTNFTEESFQTKKYAVAFTGPREGRVCGAMQIFDLTDVGSPIEITSERLIPGLDYDIWHKGRLCYNPDDGILSCSCVLSNGRKHWDHATGIVREGVVVSQNAVLMGYSHDSGGHVDFDNLEIGETKSFGDYYSYDYYGGNNCPCCGECIDELFTFPDDDYGYEEGEEGDDDTIDCRLVTSGDVEQENEVLKVRDGGSVTFDIGTPGVDGNCLPDESVGVGLSIESPDYGTQLTVTIGDISAVLTWNSGPDVEDGTLQITDATVTSDDPATLNVPIDQPLKMAALLLAGDFVAGSGGKIVSTEASGGSTVSLSVSGGEVDVSSARFMTCTSDPDVFGVLFGYIGFETDGLAECGPCRPDGGQLPISLVVLIGGVTGGFGVRSFNGAHVVDLQSPPDLPGTCEWKAAWQIPPPGPGVTDFFTYTVTITVSADTTDAYITALLSYEETGGIPNAAGQAFFTTSVPLDDDGQVDCHALLKILSFATQFQFAEAAGASVEVTA